MKKAVSATMYRCDGCGKEQVLDDEDIEINGPPMGYHGSVGWIHSSGGDKGDWFACKKSCIRDAVVNACERDDRE